MKGSRGHHLQRQRPRGRGRPYYWIGATPPKGDIEQGTDTSSVAEKYISMTPLLLDLTDYGSATLLEDVKGVVGAIEAP